METTPFFNKRRGGNKWMRVRRNEKKLIFPLLCVFSSKIVIMMDLNGRKRGRERERVTT